MELEARILTELGVDVKSIALESGARRRLGGSCVAALRGSAVLALRRRSDFEVFRSALPVLGVDGTLAGVVPKDNPAYGKVQAKTGTYIDNDLLNGRIFLRSKSLAGVMTTKSGRNLVFALFINDVLLPPGVDSRREGKLLGLLCERIYEDTP